MKWIQIDADWFAMETCFSCKTVFLMGRSIYETAQLRRNDFTFYCPNGHGQVYTRDKSEVQILREQLEATARRNKYLEDERKHRAETYAKAAKKAKLTRERKKQKLLPEKCPE